MTDAWKRAVLAKLADNEKHGRTPANLAQLAAALNADKRGIYVTFDLEADLPQTASVYVDDICELLGIDPPMVESDASDADPELQRDLEALRNAPTAVRRRVIDLLLELAPKKP